MGRSGLRVRASTYAAYLARCSAAQSVERRLPAPYQRRSPSPITSEKLRLDRHWRNARTIPVHNPLIYKLRTIGDHVLNASDLPYAWSAGRR